MVSAAVEVVTALFVQYWGSLGHSLNLEDSTREFIAFNALSKLVAGLIPKVTAEGEIQKGVVPKHLHNIDVQRIVLRTLLLTLDLYILLLFLLDLLQTLVILNVLLLLFTGNLYEHPRVLLHPRPTNYCPPHVVVILRKLVSGDLSATGEAVKRGETIGRHLDHFIIYLMPTIVVQQHTADLVLVRPPIHLPINVQDRTLAPYVLRVLGVHSLTHG
jgi:hypothetical protein